MATLVRLTVDPKGVWTTPWQADSLLGALACMWARFHGTTSLKRDFLDPWRENDPPFVLSDAFPEGGLPTPVVMPLLWEWPQERRKEIKRCSWLTHDQFREVQQGRQPDLPEGAHGSLPSFEHHIRLRNSVLRGVPGSKDDVVQLFEVPYSTLSRPSAALVVFARVLHRGGLELLLESLEMLGKVGFGADASVGHGAFRIRSDPIPCRELDDVSNADGFVSLSTHQPDPTDPTDGYWRTFIKYGKMAPEFHGSVVFKRPQVMLEPGSCFRVNGHPKPFYGTVVRSRDLLAERDRQTLSECGVHPVQAAFALAVPMKWPQREYES